MGLPGSLSEVSCNPCKRAARVHRLVHCTTLQQLLLIAPPHGGCGLCWGCCPSPRNNKYCMYCIPAEAHTNELIFGFSSSSSLHCVLDNPYCMSNCKHEHAEVEQLDPHCWSMMCFIEFLLSLFLLSTPYVYRLSIRWSCSNYPLKIMPVSVKSAEHFASISHSTSPTSPCHSQATALKHICSSGTRLLGCLTASAAYTST